MNTIISSGELLGPPGRVGGATKDCPSLTGSALAPTPPSVKQRYWLPVRDRQHSSPSNPWARYMQWRSHAFGVWGDEPNERGTWGGRIWGTWGGYIPITRAIYMGKEIKGVQHQGGMGGRMGGVGGTHPPIPPGGYAPGVSYVSSTSMSCR